MSSMKLQVKLVLGAALVSLLFFQNCGKFVSHSASATASSSSSGSGSQSIILNQNGGDSYGGGVHQMYPLIKEKLVVQNAQATYDIYVTVGQCDSGEDHITNALLVSSSPDKVVQVVRNCQVLDPPQEVSGFNKLDGIPVGEFNGLLFDLQTTDDLQHVSIYDCTASTPQFQGIVWEYWDAQNKFVRYAGQASFTSGISVMTNAPQTLQLSAFTSSLSTLGTVNFSPYASVFHNQPTAGDPNYFAIYLDADSSTYAVEYPNAAGTGTAAITTGVTCLEQ